MTLIRLISPALRSGLLLATGVSLIVAPLILQLAVPAILTGIAVGAVVVPLALAGTADEGRGTLPVSAQAVYDRGLAFGLLLAALIFGIAGETDALALFAIAGLSALIVTSITRYSARPA